MQHIPHIVIAGPHSGVGKTTIATALMAAFTRRGLSVQPLSGNCTMLESIREFAQAGGPIYAECGGFMYLTEAIVDTSGREHRMAGLFLTRARMQSRLAALGYIQPDPASPLRGHEFRYSKIDPMPAEGYRVNSVSAGYIHLHFLSCPDFAASFIRHCAAWRVRSTPGGAK